MEQRDSHEEEDLLDWERKELSPQWHPSPEFLSILPREDLDSEVEIDKRIFADSLETMENLKSDFRNKMDELSPQKRGEWGERAVIQEAKLRGHRIISEHSDHPTAPGFDCVSFDRKGTIHIWEAKNYSGDDTEKGEVRSASALEDKRLLPNVVQFLNDLPPDDPDRFAIIYALEQNKIEWHLRLGPDTDYSFVPFSSKNGAYDIRRYAYGYMIKCRG